MNSKQGARYIKRRMGNDLKRQILMHNRILTGNEIQKNHLYQFVHVVVWLMN
jgi:hypothetical protein